jgi:threonine synthase
MGLPVNKLICASNENKVLYDFINTGVYDKSRDFVITISPSMDILISSNLERLLYSISGEDSCRVLELMEGLKARGKYEITPDMKERLEAFYGGYATEEETRKAISDLYHSQGYIIDTHTAVGYEVYKKYREHSQDYTSTVIAATASPYKFTSAVMSSIDEHYGELNDFDLMKEMSRLSGTQVPLAIKDIEERPVIHKSVCDKNEMKAKVAEILGLEL